MSKPGHPVRRASVLTLALICLGVVSCKQEPSRSHGSALPAPGGDLTPKSVYFSITNIDSLYSMAGRDPGTRRGAEQMMSELIDRLQRVPGIDDPYADNLLRPCLRAAVLTRESRRLEWERIIARIPDDNLIWAGRAAGDAARKAIEECRPL